MRKRRRVTAAATAARDRADQLLPIPCSVTDHAGHAVVDGVIYRRHCQEREGHLALDIPHRWSGFEATKERVEDDVLERLGDTF